MSLTNFLNFSQFTVNTQGSNGLMKRDNEKFTPGEIPVYIPYGNCLQKSGPDNRNAYGTSDNYGNGIDVECIPSLIHTIPVLGEENNSNVKKTDYEFLNQSKYPSGVSQYIQQDFTSPDLQSKRPKESSANSYIALASKSLHMAPDMEISVFFSDSNIEHLRSVIVQKVKEITADSGITGSSEGVTIQKPNMDDLFYYLVNVYQNYKIHNGSICFVNLKNNQTVQESIAKLNTTVLQEYVSKMVSQINMYIYYYRDASQIPEQLSVPVLTSMKGSRVLEYNTGFYSGNSTGVASYNEVGNINQNNFQS